MTEEEKIKFIKYLSSNGVVLNYGVDYTSPISITFNVIAGTEWVEIDFKSLMSIGAYDWEKYSR